MKNIPEEKWNKLKKEQDDLTDRHNKLTKEIGSIRRKSAKLSFEMGKLWPLINESKLNKNG